MANTHNFGMLNADKKQMGHAPSLKLFVNNFGHFFDLMPIIYRSF